MLKKMDALLLRARLTTAGFVKELKKDERGLSGVVVAVLLILVAVLAVVMIWGFLSGWLSEMWDTITQKSKFE